jgi:hypothetical protein
MEQGKNDEMKDIACKILWDFVLNPNTGPCWKPKKKIVGKSEGMVLEGGLEIGR